MMRTVPTLTLATLILTAVFAPPETFAAALFDARMDHVTQYQAVAVDVADLDGDGVEDLALVTGDNVSVKLGQGNGIFGEEALYLVGRNTMEVAIGDLDLDGVPDLVATYRGRSTDDRGGVAVLLGNGDGTFQDDEKYFAGSFGQEAVIGDFDEDGIPDVAMVYSNQFGQLPDDGGVALYPGVGDGTLASPSLFAAGDSPEAIAMDDLDGNGYLDLAVANSDSDDLSVLLGNGNGTFQAAQHFAAGEVPQSIAIGDLDGNGAPDLAAANLLSHDISVLLGNGDGTFQTAQSIPSNFFSLTVIIEELDGNNAPDLAVVHSSTRYFAVHRGNGDGTFRGAERHWLGCSPLDGVIADLNGDHIPDLVTANYGDFPGNIGSASVLLGLGGGEFREAPAHETGEYPQAIATGDLNLDGHADLAVGFTGEIPPDGSGISILLGEGNGSFSERTDFAEGSVPVSVAIDTLDTDGIPDLVTVSWYDEYVSVYLGNGNGTFQVAATYPCGASASSVRIGDLNGDGRSDLAVANAGDDNISVLLGNGNGTFQSAVNHPAGEAPRNLVIADLNLDGIPDLVTANEIGNNVSVLLGTGGAAYQAPVNYGAGYAPVDVTVDDLDGDGIPDMATAVLYDDKLSVRFGAGDGTFGPAANLDVEDGPRSVVIGLIDDDANPDLVTANVIGNNVSVLRGNGDGTFQSMENYGAGFGPRAMVIEDFDHDGNPDLATVNSGVLNDVSILFNVGHPDRLVVVGPGPAFESPPLVRGFPPRQDAAHVYQFQAYGPERFGVNVCSGNLTGDGVDDLLTGAGPGEIYGPHVRGFQMDGTPLPGLSFFAYGTLKYGVNVAAGDLDQDGYDEVITGAGPGQVFGPHVRAFDYDGTPGVEPVPGVSFFAYGTPKWGVNISAGDIDGDGYDEIVTGAGPGAVYGPHVRGWDVDGGAATATSGVNFFAYGTLKFGVNVTCGDVDGDGIDEIVTGAGPGPVFGPHVRGWNYDGNALSAISGINFFAWDPGAARLGAKVFAGTDLDDDGRAELIVGRGPALSAGTDVKVFRYGGSGVTLWFSLNPFPGMTHGATVTAGRI